MESIAQMKPKAGNEHEEGLLEYLEDIIGTNRYIEPIAQVGRAVDAANDQCAEKHVRVRAAEREVAALQEEKQAAEDFVRQENELVAKKAELLQVLRHQAETQVEQLTSRLEEARATLAREEEASSSKAQQATDLEAALKDQAAQHRERDASAKSAAQRLSACEKEDIKLQETRKHVKGRLKTLARATAEESRAKASAQHELQHAEQELAGLGASIAALERAVADLRAQLQRPGAFPDRDRLTAHYEEKISACHQHYDRKISALIQRFEQERQSNAEIMRARMKAEVNLLLPRIRQQCLEQATRRTQEAVDHVKAKCAAYLRRMREDFDGERAALKEQMRRKLDQDRHVIYGQLKEKFDHRLAQELSHQPPAPHANPPAGSSANPSWLDRSFVF